MAEPFVRFEQYNELDDIEEYFERLELFFQVHGVANEKKVPRLLSDIGPKTYATLKNLTAPTLPAECELGALKEHLVRHFKPQPVVIAERFQFHKRNQSPGETINDFMIELRKLARSCDFGDFLDQALRDRFVCGLSNANTQRRLLSEKDLTLKRAVAIATAMEMAVLEPSDVKKTVEPDSEDEYINRVGNKQDLVQFYCCGKRGHVASQCRFRNYKCYKCGRSGHLQVVCGEEWTKRRL